MAEAPLGSTPTALLSLVSAVSQPTGLCSSEGNREFAVSFAVGMVTTVSGLGGKLRILAPGWKRWALSLAADWMHDLGESELLSGPQFLHL